tara:strand:+ start:1675 stop:1971 length:297 start_codon:yes stop_codon:yes gene_type:complete
MLNEVRDIIIIIGISISFIMLLISTTLIINVFLKLRKLANYVENSLEEISDIRRKVKESIPKPISSILDGAVTIKTLIDKVFIKNKSKNKQKGNKNGK